MVWVPVLNELLITHLTLEKQLSFWGLMHQKNKKIATVTLALKQSFQIQRKNAFKKVEKRSVIHWQRVKWNTVDHGQINVQAGAEHITTKVQGLITVPISWLKTLWNL